MVRGRPGPVFISHAGWVQAFREEWIERAKGLADLELLVPVHSAEKPTACMSFNYHQDHFGLTWDLKNAAGEPAHTGCVAFGIDRLAVAMFATHGLAVEAWPAGVREALRL